MYDERDVCQSQAATQIFKKKSTASWIPEIRNGGITIFFISRTIRQISSFCWPCGPEVFPCHNGPKKPLGNTIQFVSWLLSAVYSVVAVSYNLFTCDKRLTHFIESLFNNIHRNFCRDLQDGSVSICRSLSSLQEIKVLYLLWRGFFLFLSSLFSHSTFNQCSPC